MKNYMEMANSYIKSLSVKDLVLVKMCAWAMGFLFGIALPQKHKEKASFAASLVFVITYIVVTLPFLLKITETMEQEKNR